MHFVFRQKVLRALALGFYLLAAGCSKPPEISTGTYDPFEAQNRQVHKVNLALDRAVLKPVSTGYGTAIPRPLRRGISNVSDNLDAPADIVNNILQVRPRNALTTTARFVINSTLGVAGIFDVASQMGLEEKPTDFGETLFVWRVPEGPYTELPVLGPATARHGLGRVVDILTNPTRLITASPAEDIVTATSVGNILDTRYTNRDTIDGLYYESSDSYAQLQSIYLQNRRFVLRRNAGIAEDYADIYEDPYDFE